MSLRIYVDYSGYKANEHLRLFELDGEAYEIALVPKPSSETRSTLEEMNMEC